jgi:hypothetical protein
MEEGNWIAMIGVPLLAAEGSAAEGRTARRAEEPVHSMTTPMNPKMTGRSAMFLWQRSLPVIVDG